MEKEIRREKELNYKFRSFLRQKYIPAIAATSGSVISAVGLLSGNDRILDIGVYTLGGSLPVAHYAYLYDPCERTLHKIGSKIQQKLSRK